MLSCHDIANNESTVTNSHCLKAPYHLPASGLKGTETRRIHTGIRLTGPFSVSDFFETVQKRPGYLTEPTKLCLSKTSFQERPEDIKQ